MNSVTDYRLGYKAFPDTLRLRPKAQTFCEVS